MSLRRAATAFFALAVMSLGGCTSSMGVLQSYSTELSTVESATGQGSVVTTTGVSRPVSLSPETGVVSTQESSPTSSISDFPASYPEGSIVIGELSSRHGAAEIGPFTVQSGHIAVYVRCYGTARIHVEIVDVAAFDQKCAPDANDLGTINTFDVRYVADVTVRASAEESNIWALAVTDFGGGG